MAARLRPTSLFRTFFRSEASSGIVLIIAAAVALAIANSALAEDYFGLLHEDVFGLSVGHWINDGLMAVFFLLVGLEIKRELVEGQLATWRQRILPGACAAAGMAVPALIYVAFNTDNPVALRGWAIPSATDIAFALGILSLLGRRVPVSLRIFLAAVAILDDLGAVLVIALFYTGEFDFLMLGLAAATVLVLVAMNRVGVTSIWLYLAVGVVLWVFVFNSGLHATLAGVILAMAVPLRPGREAHSPSGQMEHLIQPWVAFVIVPLFGLANAGVAFGDLTGDLDLALPFGIAAGLFFGKQIGIFGAAYALIRTGAAPKPEGATWPQLYGVALLCGIGFTMSLFISLLAFPASAVFVDEAKLGILGGSAVSAIAGAVVLLLASKRVKGEG
ncbi:MAG: Na+/H+ antiporter NhaA [Bauldia sp.]|nr:Na+/H+ antiporter NhaA [Bauldia sp.]